MAFRASILRCVAVVVLAILVSFALAWLPPGRANDDDGPGYFANLASSRD